METSLGPRIRLASWLLAGLALLLIIKLHLLPALLAGLLVYALVEALVPALQRLLPGAHARGLIVALLSVLVVALLTLAIIGGVSFMRRELGEPGAFFESLMPLVDRARAQLPQVIVDHLPDSIDDFRAIAIEWLQIGRAHV